MKKVVFGLIVISQFIIVSSNVFAGTKYVDTTASGANNGSSWTDAYKRLQKALNNAGYGDDIWVAAGTYYPTSGYGLGIGDRGRHFRMKNGVAIYGGFQTGGSDFENRDPGQYETILSGDIGIAGDSSDNCYHVFYHSEGTYLDATAVLDGFTITGGNADSSSWQHAQGGGMYNRDFSSPTVTNCTFAANSTEYGGGGMVNMLSSSPILTGCSFTANSAYFGGGLCNYTSSLKIANCTFTDNEAEMGGGMFNIAGNPTVINCTFTDNDGGGMFNYSSSPTVTNCIIWNDTQQEIYNDDNSHPIITFSNIQGGWPGEGNIDVNPDFIDSNNNDFHLSLGSPCIDSGDPCYIADPCETDLDGNPRIVDGDEDGEAIVDMGAYEANPNIGSVIEVSVDIKPGSCRNPVNVKSMGVLPVAILGTGKFDVSTIDPASIFLNGVPAIRSSYEDVGGPVANQNECECTTDGFDGFDDLTVKFKTQDIVGTFGEVNSGDILTLSLTGVLDDGTSIEGADCVVIVGSYKPINKADINEDGVVNAVDIAIVAENWLKSSIVEAGKL